MKTNPRTLILSLALCLGVLSAAVATDKAEHKHLVTPKGGRLLDKTEPHAEFVIEKDRSVTINFYTDDMKPVPVTTQTVNVIADAKDGRAKLDFERKGDVLVSKGKLPDGEGYNIVVQFRQAPEGKPSNLRFKFDLTTCGECKRAEYACACGH